MVLKRIRILLGREGWRGSRDVCRRSIGRELTCFSFVAVCFGAVQESTVKKRGTPFATACPLFLFFCGVSLLPYAGSNG